MYKVFKRIADVLLAISLLLPVGVFLGLYYPIGKWYFKDVFFYQERVGLDEKTFVIVKLKTMRSADDADSRGRLGKLLRQFSLDELPQLINILRGDMSFVGPRPLLVEYLPLYSERQKLRHKVLPGVTGLAQVTGRNAISWTAKFEKDIYYIENQSFLLDVKILLRTAYKVFRVGDVDAHPHVTMEKFNGKN
ncbi:MAG: sugar transferase [Schleiferiaceae bacterium]|nr:sugar transferase [Schleiferiaceae bacterium]